MTFYKFGIFHTQQDTRFSSESTFCMPVCSAMSSSSANSSSFSISALSLEFFIITNLVVVALSLSIILSLVSFAIILA